MGEDEEQKQGLGEQMAEQAKQTAVNTGKNVAKKGAKKALGAVGKAIGHAIRAGLHAVAHFLAITAPYWAPVLAIFLLCVLAIFLIFNLFDTGKNESQDGFTDVTTSTEMFYDYMRIWECTTLYKYRIGEGDGGKYVGPNGYYAVYYGGSKDPTYNLAYGIVISRNYNVSYFSEVLGKSESETKDILYSYTTDGQEFTHLTADGVEKVFEGIVEQKRTYVKNKLGDELVSKLKQNQIDALSAVAYQYGNIGNFKSVYSYYEKGNKDTFRSNFKVNRCTPFLQGWEGVNVGNNARATANWNLFDTGVYAGHGYTLDPNDYGDNTGINGSIVETVIAYAERAATEEWIYSQDSDLRLKDGYADCSSLIYRAYASAGITVPTWTGGYSSFSSNEISLDSAQRGDVLWVSGHVALYAGNGYLIEASSSKGKVVKRQYGDSISGVLSARDFTKAYRFSSLASDLKLTLYYEGQKLTNYSGSRRYAQAFAITDVGNSNEIVWYGYDGLDSEWYNFYIRGYKSGSLVYKRTLQYAGHQAFDVYKYLDKYYIYNGSYGKTRYDYYSKSTGVVQLSQTLSTDIATTSVGSSGVNLDDYISSISVDSSRIAVLRRFKSSTVDIYSLNRNNFSSSFDNKVDSLSISASGSPIQGMALSNNKLYVVAGYGTYSSERSGMYVYCYNIDSGNIEWKTDKITMNLSDWEPEGIRVYGGKIYILISNKDNGKSQVYILS